jgi:hypothetical protein
MADQSIFNKLKRMFSTDVIVRNVGGKKLKIVDTDEVQYATDRNSLRDRYNRLRSSTYNLHNRDMSMAYAAARLELFRDYDIMDMDPIIASALDIYADECLVPSEFGYVLTIKSENEQIKKILENLFYDILNIEFNLWSWVRNLSKYGDFFLRLEISPEYGVYMVHPISAYELTRIEGSDPNNLNYVKYQHDGLGGGQEYENFEIAHFRLLSDSNFLPYGKSMIEPARRIWKQLSLMEDAMLIHRIMRAPEKRIFKVDVGNIPPNEIDGFMEKMMSKLKKVPYIDERTGDYNLRFNLNNMTEDFFLPVRGGDSGTSIDTLPGMEFTGTEDIEYLRNKMMAALKIPKAFLGYEEGLSGKATLAAEDVRFARTIGRMQRIIVSELTKIAIVHLYVQGYKDASLVDFELGLSNPSTVFEQEKIQIWQDKVSLAKDMMESNCFSKKWLYTKLWNMSEDDVEEMSTEIVSDKKEEWRFGQIQEGGNDPKTSNQSVDSDGSTSDIGGGEDLGGPGGGDLGGSNEGAEDLPELPDLKENEQPTSENVVDEEKERDQTGLKDSDDYPFGEDPLGTKEIHRKERDRPIRTNKLANPLRVNERMLISPRAMEEDLKSIKQTLAARMLIKNGKKVISETKSMLDESNVLIDDEASQ